MRMDGLLKTGCGSANPERDNGKDQRTKGGRGLSRSIAAAFREQPSRCIPRFYLGSSGNNSAIHRQRNHDKSRYVREVERRGHGLRGGSMRYDFSFWTLHRTSEHTEPSGCDGDCHGRPEQESFRHCDDCPGQVTIVQIVLRRRPVHLRRELLKPKECGLGRPPSTIR